jgi:hypothetical protein
MTDKDRENAQLILDQIARLRDLGRFVGQDTREQEITFITFMLRNERATTPDATPDLAVDRGG